MMLGSDGKEEIPPQLREPGVVTTVGELVFPWFDELVDEDSTFRRSLDEDLHAARNPATSKQFFVRALGTGVLAGAVTGVLAVVVSFILIGVLGYTVTPIGFSIQNDAVREALHVLRTPAFVLVTVVSAALLGAVGGVLGRVLSVRFEAKARAREINLLLPDTVAFMYALSSGGMNRLDITEAVADADDVYGEVSKEFQIIQQELQYFDVDYRTAIRNRAVETPSDELSDFLTDMLSIIDSGGDLEQFLDDKRDKHMKEAESMQERALDSLELFGEMFLNVSLFPLLLLILVLIMQLMGSGSMMLMSLTTYVLIPLLGVAFVVLFSTAKIDEVGGGYIDPDGAADTSVGVSYTPDVSAAYKSRNNVLRRIHRYEQWAMIKRFASNPLTYFVWNPAHTLPLTIPVAVLVVVFFVTSGLAPVTFDAFKQEYFTATLLYFYIPVFISFGVFSVFHALHGRARYGVLDRFTESLRKLGSANATGLTVLASIENVAESTPGKLGDEFRSVYYSVQFDDTVSDAFIMFNNRYQIPRVARTVNLIVEAHATTNKISHILSIAAEVSENQDEWVREQKQRALMQVAIVIMTFLVLLGVILVVYVEFVPIFGDLPETDSGMMSAGSLDTELIGVHLFHAVTLQAVVSGLIAGYLRSGEVLGSAPYVLVLLAITAATWGVVA